MLKTILATTLVLSVGIISAAAEGCNSYKAVQTPVPPVATAEPVQTPVPADAKKELAEADIKTPAAPKTN
jgi:hypothetical protein